MRRRNNAATTLPIERQKRINDRAEKLIAKIKK